MTQKKLTVKQQKLVDCYDGDAKKAAKLAGLNYCYVRRLLVTDSNIKNAIIQRQNAEIRPKAIANRQKRQEFWSNTMNDKTLDWHTRLRASELLGKSEADFMDKLQHKFPENCGVMIINGPKSPETWKEQSKKHHAIDGEIAQECENEL